MRTLIALIKQSSILSVNKRAGLLIVRCSLFIISCSLSVDETGLFSETNAQVVNPKIWYIGYQSDDKRDTTTPDTAWSVRQHGANILDFRTSPIGLSRHGYTLGLGACNTQIHDRNDSLILYSNGSKIFNGRHRLIEGGDSLSYGSDWQTSPFARNYYGEFYIRVYPNPMIIVPSASNSNQYYVISVFISRDTPINYKLVYTLVDMSLNGGLGKVIEKEITIKTGDFVPNVTACRHGNGRDWWIITREYSNKCFTVALLDSSGIKIVSENQCMAWDLSDKASGTGNTANRFSSDGKLFASFTNFGTELYDFDRCTGLLSNRREIILPKNDTFKTEGAGSFSPNDKFIYTGDIKYLYQIEVANLKVRLVGTWDGYLDTPDNSNFGIATTFGAYSIAPDGKIYLSTNQTTRYLHTIEKPNDTGVKCNFKLRSVKLLTYNNGLPSLVNYELGAVSDKCGEGSKIQSSVGSKEWSVYPNPVSDYLNIEFLHKMDSKSEVLLFDMLGRPRPLNLLEKQKNRLRFDVSSIPQGVYVLQVGNQKHKIRIE